MVRAAPRSLVRGAAVAVAVVAVVAAVGWAVSRPGDEGGTAAVPAEGSAPSSSSEPEEDWVARTDDDALFTVDCGFSHRAADDPIVHPGAPGASHSHDFFGSVATDASSTGSSLRGTATTCEDTDDTAAYWVPTLSVAGVPVEPTVLRAYYRARRGVDVRDVTAPPLGLAMISGDPAATAAGHDDPGAHHHGAPGAEAGGPVTGGQDVADAGWGCGLRPRRLRAAPPRDCTANALLTLQLRFPDCWDGRNLDTPDHRSHVARSVDGRCPATHPVLMTEIQLSVSWPVTGATADAVTIDSGAVEGAHGDFLNGWDPEVLAGHVDLCVAAKANCTVG